MDVFFNYNHLKFYLYRNQLTEIYFGTTRDIVNSLRSEKNIAEEKSKADLQGAIAGAILKKSQSKTQMGPLGPQMDLNNALKKRLADKSASKSISVDEAADE